MFDKRVAVYEQASKKHPARWRAATRDWSLPKVVWLNRCRRSTVTHGSLRCRDDNYVDSRRNHGLGPAPTLDSASARLCIR